MLSPDICGAECPLSSLEDPDEFLKALAARQEFASKFQNRRYFMEPGLISEIDPVVIALECLANRLEGKCSLFNKEAKGLQ